jgi:putative restriction endonuclease
VAWRAFAARNGVADLTSFLERIYKYGRAEPRELDPIIGCSILTEPFFWAERDWIPAPLSALESN